MCSAFRSGLDVTKYGDNYGTWGHDHYEEYREDFDTSVTTAKKGSK